MKRSLVPDPIMGLLDIQVADMEGSPKGETYGVDTPVAVFYDPDFDKGEPVENKVLSIYTNARYGDKTLKELKKWCKDRKLPMSGNKKKLIDRLAEHTQKIKQEKKEEQQKIDLEERRVVDIHKNKALITIKRNIRRLTVERKNKLDILVEAQQIFDRTEEQLNEMKISLKSLEKL